MNQMYGFEGEVKSKYPFELIFLSTFRCINFSSEFWVKFFLWKCVLTLTMCYIHCRYVWPLHRGVQLVTSLSSYKPESAGKQFDFEVAWEQARIISVACHAFFYPLENLRGVRVRFARRGLALIIIGARLHFKLSSAHFAPGLVLSFGQKNSCAKAIIMTACFKANFEVIDWNLKHVYVCLGTYSGKIETLSFHGFLICYASKYHVHAKICRVKGIWKTKISCISHSFISYLSKTWTHASAWEPQRQFTTSSVFSSPRSCMVDCLKEMMFSLMNWKLSTEIDNLEMRVNFTQLGLSLKFFVIEIVSQPVSQLISQSASQLIN